MRRRIRVSFGLTLVAIALLTTTVFSGCASTDSFNKLSAQLTRDAITASERNRCTEHAAPCLSDDQFKAVNVRLHQVSVAGLEYTKLRIAGTASIANAQTFIATVATETAALSKAFPDGAVAGVLAKLTELQQRAVRLLGGQ